MKYLKTLGPLLVIAAAAMTAFAGTASADTLTGPAGEPTPTIHVVNENGHVILETKLGKIECPSTASGTVSTHPAGGAVMAPFGTLTFGTCTNNWHVTVKTPGTLSISTVGGGSGTVVSNGMTVEATRFLVPCNYVTANTTIGTFTDATVAENTLGTLDIHGLIPLHSGSSELCGEGPATLKGSYASTTKLTLDNN